MNDTKAIQSGVTKARRYWDERAKSGATDCERVDQSLSAQRTRFEIFIRNHDLQRRSLLDVGCGTGDLLAHLQRRSVQCDYTGIDVSEPMVHRACERFPSASFVVGSSLDWASPRQYDFTVSIGIHNVKVDNGWDILAESVRHQFELCSVAAHLSLLTDRFAKFAPHVQAWRVEDVLSLSLSITPYVVLRHDYLPNDFSVTLYRRPLIETDHSLLLD